MGNKYHSQNYGKTSTTSRGKLFLGGGVVLLVLLVVLNTSHEKNLENSVGNGVRVSFDQPLKKVVEKDMKNLGISTEYPRHQVEIESENEDLTDTIDQATELQIENSEKVIAREAQERDDEPDGEDTPATAGVIDELGGFLFSDGILYDNAPYLPEVSPLLAREYKPLWNLLKTHEDFFREHKHRQFIPHLEQEISKAEFHEVFRKTSTPVVIPFEKMRHLGLGTKGWTLEQLRERFPYDPKSSKAKLYNPKSGLKDGLDIGPALYALSQDAKLSKSGHQRNFPRNLMIKSKYLQELGVSRPPFVDRHRFQPPTVWMGTRTSDTKFHHDCCDNFVMMVSGTKRWYIAPPTDTRHLRPIRCDGAHQSLCWASVKYPNDANMSPLDKSKLNKSNPIILDLKAGEMLYLPAGWWHHIENLGPTVMVNFWTLGCENVGLALDRDPVRKDRTDFQGCPAIAAKSQTFINS